MKINTEDMKQKYTFKLYQLYKETKIPTFKFLMIPEVHDNSK